MKIGVVLALARFYHGVSADSARLSWKLLIPAALIGAPVLLVAHQPDLGTAMLIALHGPGDRGAGRPVAAADHRRGRGRPGGHRRPS